jgi:hypothetical protein
MVLYQTSLCELTSMMHDRLKDTAPPFNWWCLSLLSKFIQVIKVGHIESHPIKPTFL